MECLPLNGSGYRCLARDTVVSRLIQAVDILRSFCTLGSVSRTLLGVLLILT